LRTRVQGRYPPVKPPPPSPATPCAPALRRSVATRSCGWWCWTFTLNWNGHADRLELPYT